MKYPGGISGPEYAAMEEGYEQGREAMRIELERAGWVSGEEHVAGIAGAVAGTLDGLAEHLRTTGMRAAAVEVETWQTRDRGRAGDE